MAFFTKLMSTCFKRLSSPSNKSGIFHYYCYADVFIICKGILGPIRPPLTNLSGTTMRSLAKLKFKLVLLCYICGLKRSSTNRIAEVGENGLLVRLKTPWFSMFTPRRSSMKELTNVNWLIQLRNESLTLFRKLFGNLPLFWESIHIASASTILTVSIGVRIS